MRLDKDLTAAQLWTIATDAQHRTADLLDQLVDHPSTYRALSDWAVAALGEEDLQNLPAPPPPEDEPESARRGVRLPTVNLLRRRQDTPPTPGSAAGTTDTTPSAPSQEGSSASQPSTAPTEPFVLTEGHEEPTDASRAPLSEIPATPAPSAAPITQDLPVPASATAARVEEPPEEDGLGAWLAAAPAATQDPVPTAAAPPGGPPAGASTRRTGTAWFRRPAPMGMVVVLAAVELLTLLALGAIAQREPAPASSTPAVGTTPSSSAPAPSPTTAVESASAAQETSE